MVCRDHATNTVLAYVFGKRKDEVFKQLKALLTPFGISRYFTDDWGAYERHLEPEKHEVGKRNTQKLELQNLDQALSPQNYLLFQARTHARYRHRFAYQQS